MLQNAINTLVIMKSGWLSPNKTNLNRNNDESTSRDEQKGQEFKSKLSSSPLAL